MFEYVETFENVLHGYTSSYNPDNVSLRLNNLRGVFRNR